MSDETLMSDSVKPGNSLRYGFDDIVFIECSGSYGKNFSELLRAGDGSLKGVVVR